MIEGSTLGKTSENDLYKLHVIDSGHNEGTICLVNGLIGAKGMVSRVWVHKQAPRIGGADFLHCWVTDSIWLKHAEQAIAFMAAYLEH